MPCDPSNCSVSHVLTKESPLHWQNISKAKISQQHDSLKRWGQLWRREAGSDVPELTIDWQSVAKNANDVTSYILSTLTEREREIVNTDATGLLTHLHADLKSNQLYTSAEVTAAFCKVSAIAHALTNCLTEIIFCEGMERATELDNYRRENKGAIIGPLHGLPVSIKDHICVKGLDTSTGYIAWANKSIATKDAVSVDILRKAGAVFYVKTANPQTLLSLETNNNIYGRTLNPFNRTLTPGGSSGGESTLIAARGSALGIGTDIGGSIRAPAGFTGIYGLKASVARLPHSGLRGSHDGMEAIIGVLGPMARSARDLSLFCRIMLQYEPWLVEPPLIQIPWNDDLANGVGIPEKLSFGILWDDGVVAPDDPILHALRRTKDALLAAGHEVIQWEPLDSRESWDVITKLYFLDGGEEYREMQDNDPAVPQTDWILSYVPNKGKPFTIGQTFKLNLVREGFRAKVAVHWNDTRAKTTTGRPIDALLSPVAGTLAPPHDATRWWGYTSYWNLVDYAGVVFPAGQHIAKDFVPFQGGADYTPPPQPRNAIEAEVKAMWKPETYDHAPISLQLVDRRLNEEKLLGTLKAVEAAVEAFKGKK